MAIRKKLWFTLLLIAALLVADSAIAAKLTCKVTVIKQADWKNYTVTVKMMNFITKKLLATFVLSQAAQNKASVDSITKTFDCYKSPQLQFSATFTPAIWQNLKGKVYPGIRIWDLSSELALPPKGSKTLNLTIKFPQYFPTVPELIDLN